MRMLFRKTFINTNNLPYLEFHHLIPFSTDNGPDHYLNLYAYVQIVIVKCII